MIKTTKTKTYNTETATVVKKVACGAFGDPTGYEMTMYPVNGGRNYNGPKVAKFLVR